MSDKSARASISGAEQRAQSELRGFSLLDLRFADGKHRCSFPSELEVRGKSGSFVEIRGYATVYDNLYPMWDSFGEYREKIRPNAGKKTLAEGPDVALLTNHTDLTMARTKVGSRLKLGEDSRGLEWIATVNTARSDVRNVVIAIEDGDISECSFAFRVTRQEWSPDYDQRDIIEYDLSRGDVSIVNFGANPATEVGLRAQDVDLMDEAGARALFDRLQKRLQVVVVDTGDDDDDDEDVACLSCGAMNEADAKYCDQCGAAMPAADAPMNSQLSQLQADLERLEIAKPRLVLA
ncbi:MAG: phage prohead protease, family [Pseudonocardiales bacterium]|nr:phage prohead protease, family [Pseudonocardiales bacterium]